MQGSELFLGLPRVRRAPCCAQRGHCGGAAIPLQSPLALCAPGTAPAPVPAQSKQESRAARGQLGREGDLSAHAAQRALLMGQSAATATAGRAQEHNAFTSGRGRGDCCRAGSGSCPQLTNFAPASAQALRRLDTSYGAAHRVRMPEAVPACTSPHAAFFPRDSISKSLCPWPQHHVQQVLGGGQCKAQTGTRPCSTTPPAPGSEPQSNRPARKTESSVL